MLNTINYGTRTAFSANSNLNSLANNAAKVLGEVDNTTLKATDYHFWLEITLNSAGVSATGTIEIYVIEGQVTGSGDSTDGIDMGSASDLAASIKNARMLASLLANANNQVVRFNARLGDYLSYPPNFWTLLVLNKSGAALNASGNDTQYIGLKEESISATGTTSSVGDSASSATLLSANTSRKGFTIVNESTADLYVKYGTTASLTDYTVKLPPYSTMHEESYTGRVDGIWSSDAGGNARITELT
jgi:hypothetical protein